MMSLEQRMILEFIKVSGGEGAQKEDNRLAALRLQMISDVRVSLPLILRNDAF